MIKSLLYLAIFTTATVITWIILSVYHNYTTSTIAQSTSIIITPIAPEFDQETIEKIKLKKVINADLSTVRVIISPEPIENQEPEASPSGQGEL